MPRYAVWLGALVVVSGSAIEALAQSSTSAGAFGARQTGGSLSSRARTSFGGASSTGNSAFGSSGSGNSGFGNSGFGNSSSGGMSNGGFLIQRRAGQFIGSDTSDLPGVFGGLIGASGSQSGGYGTGGYGSSGFGSSGGYGSQGRSSYGGSSYGSGLYGGSSGSSTYGRSTYGSTGRYGTGSTYGGYGSNRGIGSAYGTQAGQYGRTTNLQRNTTQRRAGTAGAMASSTQAPEVTYQADFAQTHPAADRVGKLLGERLAASKRLNLRSPLEVHVEDGVVVLRGTVGSDHDRELAEVLAHLEPGVGDVRNELDVAGQ